MAPSVEIAIPNTQISTTAKPYTLYNITLRLPLRSFTVQKRYSDFTTLHESLTSQGASPPPASLPPKSWFSRTVSNPQLTEERRKGLEAYLRAINEASDPRWRNTSAWRAFLNLPSNTASANSSVASGLQSTLAGPGGGGRPITDPTVWLDCHRDLKAQLHDARLHLTRRDQATKAQEQYDSSAQAKRCLVKAGGTISALDQGLTSQGEWGREKLGEGELRRRRDLVGSARKEKEGLENLLNAMATKSKLDSTVASVQHKQALIGSQPKQGRVLGKETAKTRELDNQGVLQLQKQMMEDQDLDVEELRKVIIKQKELGIAISNELEVQNEMLKMVDDDAMRVQGKIDIAKKRIGKIS